MKHDPDHYLTQPMDNQEAELGCEIDALRARMAATPENVAACAKVISELDRVTPRPLTAEDQARAVLEYLANTEVRHARANEDAAPSVGQTTENP